MTLEIIMAHFEAEIDILKCKICIRHTICTTFSETTQKVGPDHYIFAVDFLLCILKIN